MTQTFRADRHRYHQNHRDSHQIAARPAILETPAGGEEPGVLIATSDRARLVLTTEAAYRLAKQIANILTDQRASAR